MLSASHYHTSLEHKQNLQLVLWSETPKIDYLNEKELFTVNTTPTTHMYNCNLLKLMEMSIQVHEYDIALNLGKIFILIFIRKKTVPLNYYYL